MRPPRRIGCGCFTSAPGGTLSLQNLTITGGLAAGGNSQGGGAGAGLGGAIVDAGTLTVISCTFTNNKAVGGTSTTGTFSTGGGGGLGGDASGENGGPPNGGTAHGDFSDPGGFGGGGGSNLVSSAGGFGGGGGAGSNGTAGAGGFGGGGGGENSGTAANGGFGAGNGNGAVGGGGAGMGGAIFSNGGTIKIVNSTFTANTAAGGKGGTNGQGLGGAVFNRDGTLTITNSTMSADNAVDGGLEVYSFSDSDHSGGDPVTGKVATTSINNSILAQTLDPDGDLVIPDLAVSTKGSGQTDTALSSDLFNGSNLSLPASELTPDPMLGGLANNGGPTMTMALQPGSPAIDKGNTTLAKFGEPLAFDQRGSGFARVMGTSVDIGAFEVQVPTVVTSVGSTTAHGTFGVGGTVTIIVGFNEVVNVTGTPQLALNSGGTASYVSGSGTSNLTFSYTVGAGQNSSDLDEASTTALTLNGGTINDAAGKAATLTLPAPGAAGSLGANESIIIDTTAPTVINVSSTTADGDYPAGSVIAVTVAFSEPVNVTGTPSIDLNDGGEAFYASGSGTNTLTFNYTVGNGENTDKLDEASPNAVVLGNGVSIADAAGNAATLTIPDSGAAGSLGANKSIQIDTKLPTVTDFEPDTTDGTVGTPVIYTITFSETVSGLDLNSLDNTGTAPITVDSVTPDSAPNTYKVSVTPTGPGTIDLEINEQADIRDNASNSLVVPVVDTHVVNVPVPNSAPTDIQLSPNSIPENAGAGKVVGTLSDTDPDANDTATYTLVSGPGSSGNFAFAIVNDQLVARTSFNYELIRSLPILVQVTDSGGLSFTEQLTVNVLNVNEAPTASNDSASTTPDKALTIDVLSNDSDVDGDKLSLLSNTKPANGSVTVSGNKFIYTPKTGFHGVDTFTYIVSDGDGLTDKATVTITVGSGVGVGRDPVDSSITDLDIVGTSSADAIKVVYGGSQGKVQVFFGSTNEGTFNFTGRILVYGQGGNDTITIDPKITRTAIIWGDAGNDSITGGGGNDVLLGGSGDDKLNGGDGRDILIGDDGKDSLNGGGGDDILIAGSASAEGNLIAIASWNKEWSRTDKNYATRVTDITTAKGYAVGFPLSSKTVDSSAGLVDTLTGAAGQDLFYANTSMSGGSGDLITDRVKTGSSAETLIEVTA